MAIMIRTSEKGCPYIKLGMERVWMREALESEFIKRRGNAVLPPFVNMKLEKVFRHGKPNGYKFIPEEGVVTAILSEYPGVKGLVTFNVFEGDNNILEEFRYEVNVKGVKKHHMILSFVGKVSIEVTKTGEFATGPKVVKLDSDSIIKWSSKNGKNHEEPLNDALKNLA